MKPHRRLLLIAGALAACAVTLGVLALLPARPGVTKANFDRIQDGMRIEEVDQIFGGPGLNFDGFAHHKHTTLVWQADDGSIAFIEVEGDAVVSKRWGQSNETIMAKLRRWLHLTK